MREYEGKIGQTVQTVLLGNTDGALVQRSLSDLPQLLENLPLSALPTEWHIQTTGFTLRSAIRTVTTLAGKRQEIEALAQVPETPEAEGMHVILSIIQTSREALISIAKKVASPQFKDAIVTKEKMIEFGQKATQELVHEYQPFIRTTIEESTRNESLWSSLVKQVNNELLSRIPHLDHIDDETVRSLITTILRRLILENDGQAQSDLTERERPHTPSATFHRASPIILNGDNRDDPLYDARRRGYPLGPELAFFLRRPEERLEPFACRNAVIDVDETIVSRFPGKKADAIDVALSGDRLIDRLTGSKVEEELRQQPKCIQILTESQTLRLISLLDRNPKADDVLKFLTECHSDPPKITGQFRTDIAKLILDPQKSVATLRRLLAHVDQKREIKRTFVRPSTLRMLEQRCLITPNVNSIIDTHFGRYPKPPTERRLLDIGAWDGQLTTSLSHQFGHIIAIEPNNARYQTLAERQSQNFETFQADALQCVDSTDFEPDPDVILLSHLLYFIKDRDEELLSWSQETLRRNGISIIVLNDNIGEPGSRAHLRRTVSRQETHLTPQRYVDHLEARGYATQTIRPQMTFQAQTEEGLMALKEMAGYVLPERARSNVRGLDAYIDKHIRNRDGDGTHKFDHTIFIVVAKAKNRILLGH